MFASTIVFAALVATAQAEEKWEVVTSVEGRFAVEMPACDEQSGATPIIGRGMSGTLHDSIRQTDGTTFQVMWYEARSPIPKADEARWLDFVRDQKAGPGGRGKVLSEKKIKLGAIEGREYVYMDEFGSKAETRARAFVKGNSAILLLASSSRGGPPVAADADRFLNSFTFDVKPSTARKADDTPPRFDKALLLGVWEVVKGTQMPVGATLEFAADGQFRSIPNDHDSHFVARYKIKGDEVTLEPDSILTVKELTPTRLVIDGFVGPTECRRKVANAARGGLPKTGVRAGGFRFGVQPKTATSGLWETLTAKEDGFTVAMPGRPNGDEREASRGFQSHTITFESPGLNLVVMASRSPIPIPREEEAKVLDKLRDMVVEKIGRIMKIVSEKPTRLGSISGREFELTLKKNEVGPFEARGRAFASGNSAYAVLAVSGVKDRNLPPDADRFLNSFALAGAVPNEVAKAEPRPSPATKARAKAKAKAKADAETSTFRGWGTPVDPDGDVAFEPSGQSLTIRVPASPHVLSDEINMFNAPRVVAPTRGDFVATVRVDGAFDPSRESTTKKISSRQAGGLLLWKDEANHIVLQRRAVVGKEGKTNHQVIFDEREAGRSGDGHNQPAPDGPIFLRLERKNGRISAAFSADGKDWKSFKPIDASWAEGTVEVGVMAVNTSTGPHTVTFEGYLLKSK